MSRISGKAYFVYILWSASGQRFYTGISDNPRTRLQQHNTGTQTSWTVRYRPWKLVYSEQFPEYRLARQRELLLKKQKGGNGFFKLAGLKQGS